MFNKVKGESDVVQPCILSDCLVGTCMVFLLCQLFSWMRYIQIRFMKQTWKPCHFVLRVVPAVVILFYSWRIAWLSRTSVTPASLIDGVHRLVEDKAPALCLPLPSSASNPEYRRVLGPPRRHVHSLLGNVLGHLGLTSASSLGCWGTLLF